MSKKKSLVQDLKKNSGFLFLNRDKKKQFFSFYLCAQGDKGFNKDGGLRIDMGTTNNPGTSQRFILLHKRRRKFYG